VCNHVSEVGQVTRIFFGGSFNFIFKYKKRELYKLPVVEVINLLINNIKVTYWRDAIAAISLENDREYAPPAATSCRMDDHIGFTSNCGENLATYTRVSNPPYQPPK